MNRLAPRSHGRPDHGRVVLHDRGGDFVAGKIGEAIGGDGGEMTQGGHAGDVRQIGWIAIGVGVAVLLVAPLVKRLMHLDTLRDDDGGDLLGRREAGLEAQEAGVHPATSPPGPQRT